MVLTKPGAGAAEGPQECLDTWLLQARLARRNTTQVGGFGNLSMLEDLCQLNSFAEWRS